MLLCQILRPDPILMSERSWFLIFGYEREGARDISGNGARTSTRGVHEDPVGFPPGKKRVVGFSHEFIPAEGPYSTEVDNPCEGINSVARERRTQILNLVRSLHPGGSGCVHRSSTSGRIGMENGDVLHPLNVGDVVNVSVLVRHGGGDRELVPVDRICLGFCFAHGSNVILE